MAIRLTPRQLLGNRFIRFLMVGVLNSAFGYGCFAILYYLGLHYSAALLIATVLGIVFNFKTTGRLVFASNDNRRAMRFFLIYTVVYGINVAGLKIFELLNVLPYYGAAILILPMAALAFLLNQKFVFSDD